MPDKSIDELKALGALGPYTVNELFYKVASVAYNVGYNDALGAQFQSDDPTECAIIQVLRDMFKDGYFTIETAKSPN